MFYCVNANNFMKAKEAERLAVEIERKKFLEREEKLITELQQLLQLGRYDHVLPYIMHMSWHNLSMTLYIYSWSVILEKYIICDSEETQKVSTHTEDRP